jgi:hypothetical protein
MDPLMPYGQQTTMMGLCLFKPLIWEFGASATYLPGHFHGPTETGGISRNFMTYSAISSKIRRRQELISRMMLM